MFYYFKTRSFLKRLALILMIPFMLLQSFAGVFIMTAFYANRSYIAKNLCQNRNTAMAPMCGGKCVLMSKLKKEKEREDKSPELKLKDFQLISNVIGVRLLKQPVFTTKNSAYFPEENIVYLAPPLGAIFHPPLV
jgi:hypothetical protein